MELKFTKSTDSEHEIKLESTLIAADWSSGGAFAGQKVEFEVLTSFVGQGAKIEATGKSEKGKKLGKVKDVIKNNVFVGEFDVPEDIEPGDEIYFEISLPDNGLDGESARIPVYPQVEVSNLKWSAEEARRGDILTLTAEVKGAPEETEVLLTIFEYDEDKVHDKIAEVSGFVREGKIEAKWEYEYHEDVDEIPTDEEKQKYGGSYNPPEYFFTIKVGDEEYGKEQESGILNFKDWIELKVKDEDGQPASGRKYTITLPDGSEKKGELDNEGYAKESGIPPGKCVIDIEDTADDSDESSSGGTQSSDQSEDSDTQTAG